MRLADKASKWHDTQTEQKQNKQRIAKARTVRLIIIL